MSPRTRAAARRLLKDPPLAPALVLFVSYIGFGALCEGGHFGIAGAAVTTLFIFALPAQVILVDQFTHNVPIIAIGIAVTFTAVRLLPMTLALLPHLRIKANEKWLSYLAAHFVAVTVWIESMRRIPAVPQGLRVPYFFFLAIGLISVAFLGTVIGYVLAQYLPPTIAAALIFMTPIYFFLGLLNNANTLPDITPLVLGFCIAPLMGYLVPNFDLALTGVGVGTLNFLLFRRQKPTR